VAAVELVLGREHVHRAALAAADPGFAAGQLGHDDLGIDAIGQHVAVVTVAGDDAVMALLQGGLDADRNRFLADVQVAEAADQAQTVQLARTLFKAADQHHLFVEVEQFIVRRGIKPVGLIGLLEMIEPIGLRGRSVLGFAGSGQDDVPLRAGYRDGL
jgi:hypothetical protein